MGVAHENTETNAGWRKKNTHPVFVSQRRRVPSHLRTQLRDPAFLFIEKKGMECVENMNGSNVLTKVSIYRDALTSFFAHEGTSMLNRMLETKKLCEIVLKDHQRVSSHVQNTQNVQALSVMENLGQFYPASTKYRNSPNATKKMKDLAEARIIRDKEALKCRKFDLAKLGADCCAWSDDE